MDLGFIDILIRSLQVMFGGKAQATPSRFEAAQNTVAAIIVVGGLVAVVIFAVVALVG